MIEDWQAGATIELSNVEGLELLVLAGGFTSGAERLRALTWLRLPAGHPLSAQVESGGARVWYKAAPLLHHDVCALLDERASPSRTT
jgi:hypothetical protein